MLTTYWRRRYANPSIYVIKDDDKYDTDIGEYKKITEYVFENMKYSGIGNIFRNKDG